MPDLFILEAIKLRDSDTYELLAKKNNYLSQYDDGGVIKHKLYIAPSGSAAPQVGPNGVLFDIRDKIKKKSIIRMVEALFEDPIKDDFKSEKAICIADSFESYFIYTLANGIAPSYELDELISE